MGVSPQMYGTYEANKALPSVKYIINLALARNVSADYLLGLSDEPNPEGKSSASNDKSDLINFAVAVNNAVNDALQKLLDQKNEPDNH